MSKERRLRFEEKVAIDIRCCGQEMRLVGNLSLRGPAKNTKLGYECEKCFRKVMVQDEWPGPSPANIAAIDDEDD